MGICCSREPVVEGAVLQGARGDTVVTGAQINTGNNKPLKPHSCYAWTSDTPITQNQLDKMRFSYWDTQPAYSGRVEIWQTLRLASGAESVSTAQAIIDSANIIVPTGKLSDGCYDEWGNQYRIPTYCIVPPINMLTLQAKISSQDTIARPSAISPSSPTSPISMPITVVIRLNIGKDIELSLDPSETIANLKSKLLKASPEIVSKKVLMLHLGKRLPDEMLVMALNLSNKANVIQAMIA